MRLDQYLVSEMGVESRHKAQQMIERGWVSVNGVVATKSSSSIKPNEIVSLSQKLPYVSRAGEKLEQALLHWSISVKGKTCLDLGASTGGFTDCLLQHGCKHVTCVDVGHDQLHPSLQANPKVTSYEGLDARNCESVLKEAKFEVMTMDLSFISILKVLPNAIDLASEDCTLLALVKPQFEVGKECLNKKGIVVSEHSRIESVQKVLNFFNSINSWLALGWIACDTVGGDGNQEYMICAKKCKAF